MPIYNAEKYLSEAIESVLDQEYDNWELLLINDGSTDDSERITKSYKDPRIHYFKQQNKGVSAARNKGLKAMSGDFFCFLDADDRMTEDSLTSRLAPFKRDTALSFVGGGQEHRSEDLSRSMKTQIPSFNGFPRKGLVSLDPQCFINCGTWLFKRKMTQEYAFFEGLTHNEDIAFFLSIAEDGKLESISTVAQIYRRQDSSAMSDLKKLERGYWGFYQYAIEGNHLLNHWERLYLNLKIRKIMFLSYLAARQLMNAIKVLLKLRY